MTYSVKPGMSFQEKLAKQNEISRQLLVRELTKIEESKRSDMRMMETAKQRFRSRYKRLGISTASSSSDAMDVRMYETHNPGFCYHCTGEIKESDQGSSKNADEDSTDSYEVVRAMLLTDGEVDIDKVLCLHILAAHTTNENLDAHVRGLGTSLIDKASTNKGKLLSGAWNNSLPCYVLELRRDGFSDGPEFREDHRKVSAENETVKNLAESYERYVNENADIVSALGASDRLARMAPRILGKMPIISPHVYSLLGASHELRVKQAIAEGNAAKRLNGNNKRSITVDTEFHDVKSIADSFRLLEPEDDDDDERASRIDHDASGRHSSSRDALSKIYGMKSLSRRSPTTTSYRLDRSITMLKAKPKKRPIEELARTWRTHESRGTERTINDLVTIKPSYRNLAGVASKTSSAISPFRAGQSGRCYSTNSMDSDNVESSRYPRRTYRKCVYLNSPVKSFALRTREYRTVPILVNYQVESLVHSVLDVLEQVNPDKVRRIVESAGDPQRIREILRRPEVRKFVESLVGKSLISSPESFVLSAATAVDEIDPRLESFLENELVATTLELPADPCLEMLVGEIRDNIFSTETRKRYDQVTNESSETVVSPRANKTGESAKLFVENQTKEKPHALGEETTRDRELPMKRKTERNIVANKSSEGILVPDKFDKLEGKLVARLGEKNRNKIINDSTSTEVDNIKSSSKIVKSLTREKPQFKQKIVQDTGYLDPDRAILRRMTNEQRILVGRVCAALKTKRINNEGLIRERTPLAALITPVLSRESIKTLTRGTTYCKPGVMSKLEEEDVQEEQTVARTERLTGPLLAKVRRDIAEHETKRRLEFFFAK